MNPFDPILKLARPILARISNLPIPNFMPRPVFVPRLRPMPNEPSSDDPLVLAAIAGATARTATIRRIKTFFFISKHLQNTSYPNPTRRF